MKPMIYTSLIAIGLVLSSGCDAPSQVGSSAKTADTAAAETQATVASATQVTPAPAESGLQVGSTAPAFELPGSDGQTHSLSDYAGQYVAIAFFPKAFTGG